ncbi:hypothetical protein ACO1O0_000275 [Amphichorda felina]
MASFTPGPHDSSSTPPVPPPKPGSHEASGISTPTTASNNTSSTDGRPLPTSVAPPQPPSIPDPGDQWLPQLLQDKSKHDIAAILSSPGLLHTLTHAPQTAHPSLQASHAALQTALAENVDLAEHAADLEARLARQRAATQAQLLSTHALERQWRQKQSDMDHALASFAPASLYQRVAQGVQEQAAVCQAMEESFLDADDGAAESERDVAEWVRRYRDARVLYYLRQERKDRWDEGRVGGWR